MNLRRLQLMIYTTCCPMKQFASSRGLIKTKRASEVRRKANLEVFLLNSHHDTVISNASDNYRAVVTRVVPEPLNGSMTLIVLN